MLPDVDITLSYLAGWDQDQDLLELLDSTLNRDKERGYTIYGPQRAELNIRMGNRSAKDLASRGQKKLITYALYLSQAELQQNDGNYPGLLLIDDLPSELDQSHQKGVLDLLLDLPMQVVISCIEPGQLQKMADHASRLFHVKRGGVKEVVQ